MENRYNTRSPAVKRLMKEAQELSAPTDQYYAQPLEDNLFEWHFTVRGPADSEFQHGVYHGRIILPVDYPMKPPSIIWLTPNGRFETNKKICLSISGHHPESWQPSWSIRTALLAIIGFMPTHGGGAIGSLDYTADERKVLAKKSREWKCPSCGDVQGVLLEPSAEAKGASEEVKKLASQINFQSEQSKKTSSTSGSTDAVPKPAVSRSSSGSEADGARASPSTPASPAQPSAQTPSTTSFTWDSRQPRPFNPWGMPAYPNMAMGGFPLHQTASSPYPSAVSMMPRFPPPPGHRPEQYGSPFFMPGFPMFPSAPMPMPPVNPATFRLINQAQALPGRNLPPCDSPFTVMPEDPPEGLANNSSKSEKELSNKNTKNVSSRSRTPDSVEPVVKEASPSASSEIVQDVNGAEALPRESTEGVSQVSEEPKTNEENVGLSNKNTKDESSHDHKSDSDEPLTKEVPLEDTSSSESVHEVLGAEAATPEVQPAASSRSNMELGDSEPKGVRQRTVNTQVSTERLVPRENNGSHNDSGSGDQARQLNRHGRGSSGRRNIDYTGLLILVLSICTIVILFKRVLQYIITQEMI